jgi:hypothetical protein
MQTASFKAVVATTILIGTLLTGCGGGGASGTDAALASPPQPNRRTAQAAIVTGASGIAIDNYTLVSSTRVGRTVFDYTYKADVSNWGDADADITATLASTAANVTVVQGALDFGNVPLGATQTSSGTFTVRVDRSQPYDEEALSWTVQANALAPTTYQLIDQALAAGAIDSETALVYKVFAEFNDPRLPAQYGGRADAGFEASATQEAELSFDTLSPATQQLLAPLLQGPGGTGAAISPASSVAAAARASSTLSMRGGASSLGPKPSGQGIIWDVLDIVPGTLAIEWDSESPLAFVNEAYANTVKAEILANIWPKLSGLFGVPTAGKTINIILDEDIARSWTRPSADCSSADILLSVSQERNEVVAHEMTHALLSLNFPPACHAHEAHWLGEATAQWAQHFVYPPWNNGGEQVAAPWMLGRPELPLDTDEGAAPHAHQYGAYLWFLYLTGGDSSGSVNGNTLKVRQTWDAYGIRTPLQAIDAVVPGGLKKKWPAFVLYDWNREATGNPSVALPSGACSQNGSPYAYYGKWDCLQSKARENSGLPSAAPIEVKMKGAVAKAYPLAHDIKHLAAAYFDFDLSKDHTIRRIRLVQPYSSDASGNLKVQVIVKLHDKGWQKAVDWTGFQHKTLCRDRQDEDFDRVVIVLSNSRLDDTGTPMKDDGTHTKLQVSALGCSNWKGTVNGSYVSGSSFDDVKSTMNTTDATFDFVPGKESWQDTSDTQTYKVTGGSVSWSSDETYNIGVECSGSFTDNKYGLAQTTLNEAALTLGVNGKPDYAIDALMLPVADGGSWTVDTLAYRLTCPVLGNPPATLIVNHWFSVYDSKGAGIPVLPGIYDTDGGLFQGELAGMATLLTLSPGEEYDYVWELKKNGTFDSDQ